MDQVKIGKFIADLRKEKGLTQRELAETVGVSDKTISKWECGNGMPEMSMLMPLCRVLGINVNELLSGERLSDDSYSRKAEENIMNLIQEKEESKRQSKKHVIGATLTVVLPIFVVLLVITWTLFLSRGADGVKEGFNDLSSSIDALLAMSVITALMMSATRLWIPFFRSFGIVFGRRDYTFSEMKESVIALHLMGNVWVVTGILITLIGLFMILFYFSWRGDFMETWGIQFAISILSLVYGLLGKLILLPIQSRVEISALRINYLSQ
ncbi:MAG: helix-turn-helix transcriptional regulator [Acetatifactor sp.]|nr:helix-turn-helix transcriptional regulator [Acetatifactor sp.]